MGVSRDCPNFLSTPIISGTRTATNFKFRRYIHRIDANKSPLKIGKKRERGRIQGLPNFVEYRYFISGTGRATNFKFGRYIHKVHANKSPLKIWERERIQRLPKYF